MTPEERLCSRGWRLANSVWALTVILGTPVVGWLGFIYISAKSRIRTHIVMAIVFTVLGWVAIAASLLVDTGTKQNPTTGPAQSLYSAYLALLWVAMLIAAFIANRSWLLWRARNPRGAASMNTSSASLRQSSVDQPLEAGPFSVAQPRGYQPATPISRNLQLTRVDPPAPPTEAEKLDINVLSQSALVDLGLSPQQASHFVATRTRLGAFSSVQEVVTSGALHPLTFSAVQGRLTSRAETAPPSAGGRVLEF